MNTSLSSFVNYIAVHKQAKNITKREMVYLPENKVYLLISKVVHSGSLVYLHSEPSICKLVWGSDTYKVKTPIYMESFHP